MTIPLINDLSTFLLVFIVYVMTMLSILMLAVRGMENENRNHRERAGDDCRGSEKDRNGDDGDLSCG